jgi:hypothetical protein
VDARPTLLSCRVLGLLLALGGCTEGRPTENELSAVAQESGTPGQPWIQEWGGEWNGELWNGELWNGELWNGEVWNGLGSEGQLWKGIGWNAGTWSAAPWGGFGWNGQPWNGADWYGVPGQNAPTFTTLHNWINHSDANQNGVPSSDKIRKCGPAGTYSASYLNETEDLYRRIKSLSYWVSCACPAGVEIPFGDTHGRFSTTLYGGLGLAPTWCGNDPSAQVPASEMEIVSACLLARVNLDGKRFPLSLRSIEPGTAVTANERITHGQPFSWYWGNLWKSAHVDNDTMTAISNDPTDSGGPWWNMERFACSLQGTNAMLLDQPVYGRDCDSSSCDSRIEHLGDCNSTRKRLGDRAQWDASQPGTLIYKAVAQDPSSSANKPGGLTSTVVPPPGPGGGSMYHSVLYRGRSWRVMEVFGPRIIGFESPLTSYPNSVGPGTAAWAQLESGSLLAGQSADCASWLNSTCQGPGLAGQALYGLVSSQVLTLDLTGNLPSPNTLAGDSGKPVTLAIRYAWPQKLGPGQCLPGPFGCVNLSPDDCASGALTDTGVCSGTTTSLAKLKIHVNNTRRAASGWTQVHGTGTLYPRSLFRPTRFAGAMQTAYIYPVYMQDAAASTPGWADYTGGATNDTVRARFQGETASADDAPILDAAYFIPGPPPPDTDCKKGNGCWLYAGPGEDLSLNLNEVWPRTSSGCSPLCIWLPYRTPDLPPGTYSFKLTNVSGNPDLYVKANGSVSTSSYDCRPAAGAGQSETCVLTLDGRGGYFTVMVKAAADNSIATLIGSN